MQLPTIQSVRDYISGQAPNYGVPTDTALGIFGAEGNVTSSTNPYGHPDPSAADPGAYSYGPFQFNSSPGAVGPQFTAATGLDYTDPNNASQMVDYSLAQMGSTGVGPWTDPFTRGNVGALNAGMNNFGANPGTAANPLPGLTAADYSGGSTDFSAGTGNIGPVSSSDLSPGIAGPQAGAFNSQYGFPSQTGLSTDASGFSPIGDTGFASVTPSYGTGSIGATPAGQYSVTGNVNQSYPGSSYGGGIDTSGASSGTGQYSGMATTNTSPSTYGGSGAPVTPGPGMPVSDQGVATGINNAGTSVSQSISGPLSGSVKTAGQDVTTAGQTVSSGVNQAANTVSSTGVGILAGIEKYVGEFFLYGAVLVVGVIFLAIGLSKFGGPKVQVARA